MLIHASLHCLYSSAAAALAFARRLSCYSWPENILNRWAHFVMPELNTHSQFDQFCLQGCKTGFLLHAHPKESKDLLALSPTCTAYALRAAVAFLHAIIALLWLHAEVSSMLMSSILLNVLLAAGLLAAGRCQVSRLR